MRLDEALKELRLPWAATLITGAFLDNFCWCDPVSSAKNPDGEYKLAQLVRANKALFDYALAFSCPMISGKDNMKNDYMGTDVKISIPPTILI